MMRPRASTIFDLSPLDVAEAAHAENAFGRSFVVLTPNQRLSAALQRSHADVAQQKGHRVWTPLDVLPLSSFWARLFRAHSLTSSGSSVSSAPTLLRAHEADRIWRRVLANDDEAALLLSTTATVKQLRDAWTIQHQWQMGAPSAASVGKMRDEAITGYSEDAKRYFAWSNAYREECKKNSWLDDATLPDWLRDIIATSSLGAELPATIFLAGFDIVTPQLTAFCRACEAQGVRVQHLAQHAPLKDGGESVNLSRHVFAHERDECLAAAAWARETLQRSSDVRDARIAIVVPDLAKQQSAIVRALRDSLDPISRSARSSGTRDVDQLFNVSLGQSLADYGLVRDAMSLLRWSFEEALDFSECDALIRSPFLGRAEDNAQASISRRAKLAVQIAEYAPTELRLRDFIALAKRNKISLGDMEQRAQAILAAQTSGDMKSQRERTPREWCEAFVAVLDQWQFARSATLASREFQVRAKLHETIAALATYERVEPRMRKADALAALAELLADTTFQPESQSHAPIQVLGVLESAGLAFDAMWVMRLSADAWPIPARANPWLPIAWQRNAGVVEASPARSLALDQAITKGWHLAARTLVFSHANESSAEERDASALIRDVPLAPFSLATHSLARSMRAHAMDAEQARQVEHIDDFAVPVAFDATKTDNLTKVPGGAGSLRDVAACPYRAFARHRLKAKPLSAPTLGLDAMARGVLLHRVLNLVWKQLRDHATLIETHDDALAKIIHAAVDQAIAEAKRDGADVLDGRFAHIERTRLSRLVTEWLAIEKQREAFTVVAMEETREIVIDGARMKLRIDRMDRLTDGTHVLIDYKSGKATVASWWGRRPDEPQLPLYLATSETPINAIAFATVKRGESMGFVGASQREGMLPSVKRIDEMRDADKRGHADWRALRDDFSQTVHGLVQTYLLGDVSVDPKRSSQTCAQCDLQSLCRVNAVERDAHAIDDEDAAEA